MSRQIDFDKPLSAEDRAWLHEWSQDWRIEENERKFGKQDGPLDEGAAPDTDENGPQSEGDGQTDASAGDDQEQPSLEDQIAALTVPELKDELKEVGESLDGNKKELQDRLLKALEDR